jgi:hypothetical protein
MVIGYHATNSDAAARIASCGFRCGTNGLAGGAIYFATSEADARRKSNHGNAVVLVCELALGRTLTLDQDGDPSMTLHKLNGMGYESVKIRRNGDEYAVYEPWRVHILHRQNPVSLFRSIFRGAFMGAVVAVFHLLACGQRPRTKSQPQSLQVPVVTGVSGSRCVPLGGNWVFVLD